MIQNYNDFCKELLEAGFSVGLGGNGEDVFTLLEFGWNERQPDSPIRWHSGDLEHDPWEWRMRVLDDRDDVAYSKVFFRKAGYITKEWYPYFLAVRRENNLTFEEAYADGVMSLFAKRIYEVVSTNPTVAFHEIKQFGGFSKNDQSKFERALVELQMKLFITMCGSRQKQSRTGKDYGWASTMFCTTERFWGDEVFQKAAKITKEEAMNKITKQVYRLNPNANERKIKKFLEG